jgi:hypothetical protein
MATTDKKTKSIENPQETMQKLQDELIHVVNVSLVQYGGMLGFCSACVLSILSGETKSTFTLSAFLCFIIAMFCFATVVLSLIFVLSKGAGLHIGHVIIQADSKTTKSVIGMLAMVSGLALYSAKISLWCIPFVLIGAVFAFRSQVEFNKKFGTQEDARKLLQRIYPDA